MRHIISTEAMDGIIVRCAVERPLYSILHHSQLLSFRRSSSTCLQ